MAQPSQQQLDTQLREAAARDDVAAVRTLIGWGANPYATDEKGRTSFNRAASNGLSALAYLTEIAFEDTQKPPAERRWPEYGLNTPSGAYQSTLITYAAKVSPVALVKRMIEAGADITIINGSGWTLLHCAAVMPERTEVLPVLMHAFQERGLGNLITALSTNEYKTDYGGHTVVYAERLTAAGLCRARIQQDPGCPPELFGYLRILEPPGGGARPLVEAKT